MEPDDLTDAERAVVQELREGRATPRALSDWCEIAISTTHNALGRLQAAGHVEKVHETAALYELIDDPLDGEAAPSEPTHDADPAEIDAGPDPTPDAADGDAQLRETARDALGAGEYAVTDERVDAAATILATLRDRGELTTAEAVDLARDAGVTLETAGQWWSETARPVDAVESERGSNVYRWTGGDEQ